MISAGVIVTYNRKELLAQNIAMQIKQNKRVDKLYVIDNNGTDNSYEYLKENKLWDKNWMEYVKLPENTGGAGGFYYGLKKAYEAGFDYIWLMDDDGRPLNEKTWENICNLANRLYGQKKELLLNSLVTVEGNGLTFGFALKESKEVQWKMIKELSATTDFYEGVANPFNGTLVTKETVKKVGFPNKDFFMARDETDYFRRCEDADVKIGTALHSIYHHPRGKDQEKKIGKLVIPLWSNMDKEYYWIRNMTYSYKEKHKARLIVLLMAHFFVILIWQNHRMIRLKQFFRAIGDAKKGKMGRRE